MQSYHSCRVYCKDLRQEGDKKRQRKVTDESSLSNMKMIFIISVFLVGGLWETEAESVTGVLGREVTITCSHSYASSNVKYFCKGACGYEDILISSRKKREDSDGRYSINDSGNTFYVTISSLTEKDAGTYWCGIERVGVDTYNEVVLIIKKGNPDDALAQSNASFSKILVYVGASLGVIALALAIVLLMFFRHRKRDTSASSGKDHDVAYATVTIQKQNGQNITTSSLTANKDQDTDSRTNGSSTTQHQDTSNIYSNVAVSSEPQIQPEGLFYSTVSFNKHTDCSTVTPHNEAPTYSAIKIQSNR